MTALANLSTDREQGATFIELSSTWSSWSWDWSGQSALWW